MSKLGGWLGFTDEKCPVCGGLRVEKWGCGKHICEKCHWCIEEGDYHSFDDEPVDSFLELPESLIDKFVEIQNRTRGFDHVCAMYGVEAALKWSSEQLKVKEVNCNGEVGKTD